MKMKERRSRRRAASFSNNNKKPDLATFPGQPLSPLGSGISPATALPYMSSIAS